MLLEYYTNCPLTNFRRLHEWFSDFNLLKQYFAERSDRLKAIITRPETEHGELEVILVPEVSWKECGRFQPHLPSLSVSEYA